MNKPMTIEYEEFRQNLAGLINDCSLPAFVISSILKDYLEEVNVFSRQQYASEKMRYEQELNRLIEIEKANNPIDVEADEEYLNEEIKGE